MKQLMILFIALGFLMGCATSNKFSMRMVERDAYMERALKFDTKQRGEVRTLKYQLCYNGFLTHLFEECVPLVEEDTSDPNLFYWGCCWDALDVMEDCMEDGT